VSGPRARGAEFPNALENSAHHVRPGQLPVSYGWLVWTARWSLTVMTSRLEITGIFNPI